LSFLLPSLLWFAIAAAIPVAIHLLNRRRHQTIPWAAMQFLLKATRESRGKKKLRQILILACRTLALAALALAAARPVVSGLGGKVDTVVLVLDRSASMEAKPADGVESRRATVLAKVRDTMRALDIPRLVLVDSAGGAPQDVPSPDVLSELSATAATDTAADLPALVSKAAEFCADAKGRTEIWIATDLQASNWRPDDDRWANLRATLAAQPRKPAVRVLDLSGPAAPDASIRLLAATRTGDELAVEVEIARSDARPGTLPLTLQFNGSHTTEPLAVTGQSLRFRKSIPLPAGSEQGFGGLSLPADGNPRNNAAFFAYGPEQPVKSLVVAPPGEAADYLLLAAAPPEFARQSAVKIDPAQAAALPLADISSVLWAAPLPTGPAATALESFLANGGQVLFLPPGEASATAFLDVKWSAPGDAPSGKFFILKDWSHQDGPLRDGTDGNAIPAERLKAVRRQLPLGHATALASWDDAEPFLVRRVVDRGTAWFAATPPDYRWSNLGDADVLLPLVQRLVAAGADRFSASYLAELGSDTARLQPGETRVRLDAPGSADTAPDEAGVYRLGDRLTAVNRPLAEDAAETVTREQLDACLENTGYTHFEQAGKTSGPASRDFWRPVLAAMLVFLLTEALLCLPRRSSEPAPARGPQLDRGL